MINAVKAFVGAPSRVRRDRTDPERSRRDDDNVPWWLILIPATLVTMIFVVTALAFLLGTTWRSKSLVSDAEVQVGLPVTDDSEMSKTTPSAPAFSR